MLNKTVHLSKINVNRTAEEKQRLMIGSIYSVTELSK